MSGPQEWAREIGNSPLAKSWVAEIMRLPDREAEIAEYRLEKWLEGLLPNPGCPLMYALPFVMETEAMWDWLKVEHPNRQYAIPWLGDTPDVVLMYWKPEIKMDDPALLLLEKLVDGELEPDMGQVLGKRITEEEMDQGLLPEGDLPWVRLRGQNR